MAEYEVTPPPDRLSERVQIRTVFSTEWGEVTQFMVQLEYWYDGDWHEVVRYDHDREASGGHDVTEEGLHRDVYRNGEKCRVEAVTPPMPAGEAFNYAKDDFREKLERFIERFERWHGMNGETNL